MEDQNQDHKLQKSQLHYQLVPILNGLTAIFLKRDGMVSSSIFYLYHSGKENLQIGIMQKSTNDKIETEMAGIPQQKWQSQTSFAEFFSGYNPCVLKRQRKEQSFYTASNIFVKENEMKTLIIRSCPALTNLFSLVLQAKIGK